MCLGFSINFSINILSSPKLDFASLTDELNASSTSSSDLAILIPFPPPPAEAFIITGKPIFFEISRASSESLIIS